MSRYLATFILIMGVCLSLSTAYAANEAPQTFTLDGQLFHAGTTNPLVDSAAKLTVQILDPSESCVLYEETQILNTTASDGFFTIQVGSLVGSSKRSGLDPAQSMETIFQNTTSVVASSAPGKTCTAGTYTPVAGDIRYFRLIVTPSTGTADTLSPDMVLDSVPNALVAQSVQGLDKSNILQVNTTAGEVLTQANLQTLFTASAFANLGPVLAGKYVQSGAGGATLPGFPAAPSSLAAGDIWYDSTNKQIDYTDGSNTYILGTAGAGLSSLTVGSNLTANGVKSGVLNAPGTIDLSTTGVTAGTYPKVTVDTYGRVSSGTTLVQTDIPILSTAGAVVGSAITSGTITGTTAISTSGNLQTSGDLSAHRLFLYDQQATPNYVGLQIPASGTTSYTMTFPPTSGSPNQVLATDGTGVLSWTALNDPTKVPLAGGTMTGLLILSADPTAALGAATKEYVDAAVGTAGAGTYVRIDGSTAFTGNQSMGSHNLTNVLDPVNAQDAATKNYVNTTLIGKTLPAAPTVAQNGQALMWNNGSSAWQFFTPSSGTVTSVVAGTGLNVGAGPGGTITTTGTLNVNVGTGNNQIVQLNGSAQLPAVDGSQLTNLSAAQITAGLLPLTRGGTGAAVAPAGKGEIVYSNSTTALTSLAASNSGYVLTSAGAGNAPLWAAAPPDNTKVPLAGGTMSGLLILSADPSAALGAATKEYVDTAVATAGAGTYLPLAGGTMTGALVNNSNNTTSALAVTQTGTGAAATFNGNVGIGTASPSAQLSVYGAQVGASVPYVMTTYDSQPFTQGAGAGIGFGAKVDAAGDLYTFAGVRGGKMNSTSGDYAGYLAFYTRPNGGNNTEQMRITSSGSVGIGTTAPTALLNLGAGTATLAPLQLTAGTNLTAPLSGAIEYDGSNLYFTDSTATRRTIASTNSSGSESFTQDVTMSGASTGLAVTNNETVGGTLITTGAATFNGGEAVTLSTASNSTAALSSTNSGSSNTGYGLQVINNSSTGWGVYSSGTSPNYFAGNVGIGTTTPGAPLDVESANTSGNVITANNSDTGASDVTYGVYSTVNSNGINTSALYGLTTNGGYTYGVYGNASKSGSGTYGTGVYGVSNSANGSGVRGQATSVGGSGVYAQNSSASGNAVALYATTSSAAGYAIYSAAGQNYFAGNVGIGTTSPGSTLEVNGTATIDSNLAAGSGAFGGTGVAPLTVSGTNSSGSIANFNGASGVPSYINIVGQSNEAGALMLTSTGNSNWAVGTKSDAKLYFSPNSNLSSLSSSAVMALTSGGSVGIGTTSPTAALNIKAGTASLAPLQLTAGTNLTTPLSGAIEYDGTNLYYTDSTATRRTLSISSSSFSQDVTMAGAGTGLAVTNNETVGGTLGVTGLTTLTGGFTSAGTDAITNTTASSSSTTGALTVAGGVGVAGSVYSGATVSAATSMITPQIYGSTAASGNILIDGTSGSPAGFVLLASAAGSVGIGTTSPGSPLEVDTSIATSGSSGIYSNDSGSGYISAIKGYASATGGYGIGVYGLSNAGGGGAAGVSGKSAYTGGNHTYGTYSECDGTACSAAYGTAVSTTGTSQGGYFTAATTGAGVGVYASETGASNTGYGLQVVNNSASGWGVYSSGTSPNYFAGSVGIGTTSPSSALQVSGVTTTAGLSSTVSTRNPGNFTGSDGFTGYSNDVYLTLTNTSSNVSTGSNITFQSEPNGSSTQGVAVVEGLLTATGGSSWTGALTFGTANYTTGLTEKMRITSTGSVGIGTTSPTALLNLAAGTATLAPLQLTSGTNLTTPLSGAIEYDGTNLYYTDSTATRRTIASTNGSGSSSFTQDVTMSGASTGLAVTNNETVGGTLITTGAATFNGGEAVTLSTASNSAAALSSTNSGSSNTGYGLQVINNSSTGWGVYSSGTSPNYFAGNVGIGTSSPIAPLQVVNATNANVMTITTTNNVTAIGSVNAALAINNTDTTSGNYSLMTFQQNALGMARIGSVNLDPSDGDFTFQVRNSGSFITPLYVKHTGNIGIGTTTPTSLLNIAAGTSSIAPLQLTSGTNLTTPLSGAIEYDGTNLYYTDSTATRRTVASTNGSGSSSFTQDVTLSGTGTGLAVTNNATVGGNLAIKTYTETVVALGNITGATGITWSSGSVQNMTLTGNITLSFSGATTGQSMTLYLTQDGTGSRTITWPSSGLKWANGGAAPTTSTTAGYTDIISFFYDGTTYWGFVSGLGAH